MSGDRERVGAEKEREGEREREKLDNYTPMEPLMGFLASALHARISIFVTAAAGDFLFFPLCFFFSDFFSNFFNRCSRYQTPRRRDRTRISLCAPCEANA